MKMLEEFLKPTQGQLFKMLYKMFGGNALKSDKNYILVKGEIPIMLVAHLDTVHQEPVRDICRSKDKNILMSPQGIGGDDRCGVYALVNAYELSAQKPYLLFTCDEEIGGVGANFFCRVHKEGGLPKIMDKLKCIIEIDRKGSNDAVFYDCANPDFEKYITSKGFKTAYGSFSDISVIAPELGAAAVNLSSGYYNPHSISEYINRAELNNTLQKVIEICSDAAKKDFPKYEYIEAVRYFQNDFSPVKNEYEFTFRFDEDVSENDTPTPKAFKDSYDEDLYWELVEDYGYKVEELEYFRECYGERIICEIYIEETRPFVQKTNIKDK